jgi:hypothetical protein
VDGEENGTRILEYGRAVLPVAGGEIGDVVITLMVVTVGVFAQGIASAFFAV